MRLSSALEYTGYALLLPATWLVVILVLGYSKTLQRNLLYLHRVPIWWGQKLDKPETAGFLHRQVAPLRIATPDGASLFAWLIIPLKVYAQHDKAIRKDRSMDSNSSESSMALKLLRENSNSRMVIYFHGNAGSVAQPRRTDAYRMLSSGASDPVFLLAFDYRGFALSSGSPSENGLLLDAVTVIQWAIDIARVDSSRIVLVAQSLGTAVAAAAAEYFISQEPKVEFAGVVLCAPFCDAASAWLSYRVGGFVPVLAPIKAFTATKKWFEGRMYDTWLTSDRIQSLVKQSDNLHLIFIHAKSDKVLAWKNSKELYRLAVRAAAEEPADLLEDSPDSIDVGEGGSIQIWSSGAKSIREEILLHGGHNDIMKWATVSLAIYRAFHLD